MSKTKQELTKTKREFLLTFFKDKFGDVAPEYDEKEVNGFWLVKSWNGTSNFYQVAIFSKESFKKYKSYRKL